MPISENDPSLDAVEAERDVSIDRRNVSKTKGRYMIEILQAKVDVTPSEIKVFVNAVPHLILRRSDVVGVQGYIKNIGPVLPIYFIEITMKTGPIVCDYADRALWEDILGGMNYARMFDERMGELIA